MDAVPALNAVVDLETGERSDARKLSLATYALALEEPLETLVDHGLLVYVSQSRGLQVETYT